MSRTQGHSAVGRITSMKIPMAQTGIESATIWLVAQCLNELRYRVPGMCCTLFYYLH